MRTLPLWKDRFLLLSLFSACFVPAYRLSATYTIMAKESKLSSCLQVLAVVLPKSASSSWMTRPVPSSVTSRDPVRLLPFRMPFSIQDSNIETLQSAKTTSSAFSNPSVKPAVSDRCFLSCLKQKKSRENRQKKKTERNGWPCGKERGRIGLCELYHSTDYGYPLYLIWTAAL